MHPPYPRFKPIVICGSHMRQGGATAVQEVACTRSNAEAYIDEAVSRGLDIDDLAPFLECQLSVPMNLLKEVAKYRAFRSFHNSLHPIQIICYTSRIRKKGFVTGAFGRNGTASPNRR